MACTRPDIAHSAIRKKRHISQIKITAGANELLGDAMCPQGKLPLCSSSERQDCEQIYKTRSLGPKRFRRYVYIDEFGTFPLILSQRPLARFSPLPHLKRGGSNAITAHMEISLLDTFDPQVRNLEAAGNLTRKVPLTGMALGNR